MGVQVDNYFGRVLILSRRVVVNTAINNEWGLIMFVDLRHLRQYFDAALESVDSMLTQCYKLFQGREQMLEEGKIDRFSLKQRRRRMGSTGIHQEAASWRLCIFKPSHRLFLTKKVAEVKLNKQGSIELSRAIGLDNKILC